jgi:hypothetical protein
MAFHFRDCTYLNFMMDATQMYPSGYHPARPWKSPDSKQEAKFLTRTQRPPRYYLVGFGKARRFELVDGWPIEPAVGAGVYLGEGSTANPRIPKSGTGSPGRGPGGTESAMAIATGQIQMQLHAVDPFAHDVFCVGSTIKRWYLDVSIFSLFSTFILYTYEFRQKTPHAGTSISSALL